MYFSGNTRYVELRADPFSPIRHGTKEDPYDVIKDYVAGIIKAKKVLDGFDANLTICIAKPTLVNKNGDPDLDKIISAEKEIEKIIVRLMSDSNIKQYVLGIDAVNAEIIPLNYLKGIFSTAKRAGLIPVPHAGEYFTSFEDGIQNIIYSIEELGAKRIGHCLAAVLNPKDYLGKKDYNGNEYDKKRVDKIIFLQYCALNLIKERGVVVEVNPSPNVILYNMGYEEHPVDRFLKHDIPIVIGTDDCGIFGNCIKGDIYQISKAKGFSISQVEKLLEDSKIYSLKNLTKNE